MWEKRAGKKDVQKFHRNHIIFTPNTARVKGKRVDQFSLRNEAATFTSAIKY